MLDVNATQHFIADDKWRGGNAAVALLTFDVDGDTPLLAEDEHYAQHLSTMSHGAYGPKVGIFRIIEMLARHEKPATFSFPDSRRNAIRDPSRPRWKPVTRWLSTGTRTGRPCTTRPRCR